MTAEALDVLVRRDDLNACDVVSAGVPQDLELAPGEVLLRIDAFALTANNITYATMGDLMSYWRFFPAPQGLGRIPVWGFANVERSAHADVAQGERIWGYFPMSTHLVVAATDVDERGFTDGAAHRADLPAFYNRYLRTAADRGYDPGREAEQMLLRPLFATAFLIDDLLADADLFGATGVVLSGASSKTAYATAFFLAQRPSVEVIGLTSASNVAFCAALGCYDRVIAYEDLESLPADRPLVSVDFTGSADVRSRLHHHLGDALRYDCAVGATHHDELGADPDLPGPAPVLFFAPALALKRVADWGPAEFEQRLGEAWRAFLAFLEGAGDAQLRIVHSAGPDAVLAVYRDVLHGRARPDEGHVLTLLED